MKKIGISGNLVFQDEFCRQKLKNAKNYKNVELDFNEVEMIDSVGVSLIATLWSELRKKNGDLVIVNARDEVRHLLELTGMPVK